MKTRKRWLGGLGLIALVGAWSVAAQAAGPASPTHAVVPVVANPTPQEETYQGCPPPGDGGDAQLNVLKNRIDRGHWQPVSIAGLLALTWPPGVEKVRRSDWSPRDVATVARSEGRPVMAEGYILLVRHEGPESPNCHDATQRDYHVWLAASSSDGRARSSIVELTPRVVARNPGWGDEASIQRLSGQHVRISGWLLLDQEHPEQLHRTRGTLWEIHPVLTIAVQRGGQWVDLATGKPDTSASPSTQGTPVVGGTTPTATPATSGGILRVVVTVRPDPTERGTPTTVQARTTAGAECTVRVVYPSGSRSTSSKLQTGETADTHGRVSWTWTPSSRSTGTATATVHCTLGSRSVIGTAAFTMN